MLGCVVVFGFFFFKQKTAYEMRISDWSSDVCSSDLGGECKILELRPLRIIGDVGHENRLAHIGGRSTRADIRSLHHAADGGAEFSGQARRRKRIEQACGIDRPHGKDKPGSERLPYGAGLVRSEERRGGKEGAGHCKSRETPVTEKK